MPPEPGGDRPSGGAPARPLCECHGEPMRWAKDARRDSGGRWRCVVKCRAYGASPKGRAVRRAAGARYEASPKGRAERARYEASPERRAANARYKASPKGRAVRRAAGARYEAGPKGQERRWRQMKQALAERIERKRARIQELEEQLARGDSA